MTKLGEEEEIIDSVGLKYKLDFNDKLKKSVINC